MPLVLGGSSAVAAAYSIDNSCRFNNGDSPGLVQTPTAGDPDKWTYSIWFKRSDLTSGTYLLTCVDGANDASIGINSSDILFWTEYQSGTVGKLQTNRVFRDVSAWYHIVFTWDSANGTPGNRMRMYINGTEETSFSTDTNPTSGQDSVMGTAYPVAIGSYNTGSNFFGGYFAEVAYCNGQAYAASDFGEFDSDSPTIWKPKDISGLTFGTGGFYLDFEDSANLGADVSGQGNDFTESNLIAADQCQDSPTNNFCTLNGIDNFYGNRNFSSGNNEVYFSGGGTQYAYASSTMSLTAGKWYWEMYIRVASGTANYFGFAPVVANASNNYMEQRTGIYATYSYAAQSPGFWQSGGTASTPSSMGTATTGDYISMALDLENNFAYVGVNGTWLNSGDPTSGATGTGARTITAAANMVNGWYTPAIGLGGAHTPTMDVNFGNGSFGVTAAGATNADDNGYGVFKYDVPEGYLAICTKNLGSDGG